MIFFFHFVVFLSCVAKCCLLQWKFTSTCFVLVRVQISSKICLWRSLSNDFISLRALWNHRDHELSRTHTRKKNKLRTARKCTRLIVTRCWLQSINLLPTKLFAFLSRVNWFCNIFYYRHQVLCVARALCEFCSFYLAINCTNFERSLTHLARFELELFSLFVAVIYSAFNSMK